MENNTEKIVVDSEEKFMIFFHDNYSIDWVCGELSQRFEDEITVAPLEAAEKNCMLHFLEGYIKGNHENLELKLTDEQCIDIISRNIWIYG